MLNLEHIRRYENIHIVLWLLKDTCWVLMWRTAGMMMIVPTVLLAIYITWLSRTHKRELSFNLAVCCWILANSTWMIGEFYYDDNTRPLALVFFIGGFLNIGVHYLMRLRNRENGNPA